MSGLLSFRGKIRSQIYQSFAHGIPKFTKKMSKSDPNPTSRINLLDDPKTIK